MVLGLLADLVGLLALAVMPRRSIEAENLVLRRQLALFKERGAKPRHAICERVIGTARRECLDWLIPVSEAHLRAILKCWVTHYNGGRPHSALGPGVPDPPKKYGVIPKPETRHHLATDALVLAKSILGGLHHEYSVVNVQSSA